jgi:CHAT domain-containing protein
MNNPAATSHSVLKSSALVVALLLALAMAAVGLFLSGRPEESRDQELIRDLSAARIGGARFFRSADPFDKTHHQKILADAELSALSMPDSPSKRRIRGLIEAGNGRLQEAAKIFQPLNEADRDDPELLNDLGVVYLALAEQDPVNYFRALTLFERAKEVSPRAMAPRFNRVLAYRRVGLRKRSAEALDEYRRLEINSFWLREIPAEPPTDERMIAVIRESLSKADTEHAGDLVLRQPDLYRSIAIDYALDPPDNGHHPDRAVDFILKTLCDLSDDRTIRAILAPLETPEGGRITHARALIRKGIDAYQQAKFIESARFYDLAEDVLKDSGSVFDGLWLELNRVEIDLRSLENDKARPVIEHVVARARTENFSWLLAHALTSQGSNVFVTRNFDDSLRLLQEAVRLFDSIGTPRDSVRALSAMAAIHRFDPKTSLQFAFRALPMTRPDDHIRLSSLYLLSGQQLYRSGFREFAIEFEKLAEIEAAATNNPALIAGVAPELVIVYADNHDYPAAQRSLNELNAELKRVENPGLRLLGSLQSNSLCARIQLDIGNPEAAEQCLKDNLDILGRQPDRMPIYFAQTLLQLSQTYALRGDLSLARQKVHEAVEFVEHDDAYMANEGLRVSFENERRKLYEVAIGLEYDHGDRNSAWNYVQRYRAKLFLEFLGQMNPGTIPIRSSAIGRDGVEQLIPRDTQIVEYVLLKDRMLIWLVSENKFTSVVVPVTRMELEERVSRFLEQIQQKAEITGEAEQLYRLLIGPIEDQLDPQRTLAIIPDQVLHRLSFSALRSPSKGTYLIESFTLLESPSLTALLAGGTGTPRRIGAVGFGAQKDDTSVTQELRSLQRFYQNMTTYNGSAALKPAFLSSLVNAGVFHYAGHSQDASDPLRSSILLDGNREGPNSVSAVDIASRRMPANSVVVLASCDSSVGNSRDGLGMRGLTSAFLISGAGSVVGSLWLVEAENTSRLILSFHKTFAEDRLPVAEALRNATLDFISRGVHPYYWSGFVVTGNLSALR